MQKSVTVILSILITFMAGCEVPKSNKNIAKNNASKISENRTYDEMKNDVEYRNYSKRQKLADDPATIIWCTTAFPIPSSPIFTVPIVSKLTSGDKSPFPKSANSMGPDAMYGHSGEYRYGFTPADMYVDYYNMATFCTSMPTIWQRESTQIVMQIDPKLMEAQKTAIEIMRLGIKENENTINPRALNEAYHVLEEAIKGE